MKPDGELVAVLTQALCMAGLHSELRLDEQRAENERWARIVLLYLDSAGYSVNKP